MIEFLTEHSAEFVTIGGLLMALGGVIVKLTPTKKDDDWYQKIKSVFKK